MGTKQQRAEKLSPTSPGPFYPEIGRGKYPIAKVVDSNHYTIAILESQGDPSRVTEVEIANTHLLAASYGLLMACKAAMAVLEHTLVPPGTVAVFPDDCDDRAVQALKACGLAIALAEGRE